MLSAVESVSEPIFHVIPKRAPTVASAARTVVARAPPPRSSSRRSARPRAQEVGSAFERNAPEVVHRVLGSEKDSHAGPERGGEAEPEGEHASVQRASAELRADDGELAKRGVDDLLFDVRVTLEDEAEHRREHEEQREDREEAVVGDRGGEVGSLIVGVLLQHRERKAEGAMPLLEAIERAVSGAEAAHDRVVGTAGRPSRPARSGSWSVRAGDSCRRGRRRRGGAQSSPRCPKSSAGAQG